MPRDFDTDDGTNKLLDAVRDGDPAAPDPLVAFLHDDLLRFADTNEALDGQAGADERAVFLSTALPGVGNSLGYSQATIERDRYFARAWLRDRLKSEEPRL